MFTCNFDRPPYFKFSGPVQHFHIWYDEYDSRKFWKRFSGCFDLESRLLRKTVAKSRETCARMPPGPACSVSSWLCDLFPSCVALWLCPWATHKGNKSHNPSLQADNPYFSPNPLEEPPQQPRLQ